MSLAAGGAYCGGRPHSLLDLEIRNHDDDAHDNDDDDSDVVTTVK